LGTVFFSVAMLRHPRLGRAFGIPWFVIGVVLLVLNFSTFPTPPTEAGSVDLGPLVGLDGGTAATVSATVRMTTQDCA